MKKIHEVHEVYGDSEVTYILNLTQHQATPDQIAAGVMEPSDKEKVQALLTFNYLPSMEEIYERAEALSDLASECGATQVMIGGAPYLMAPLQECLTRRRILPLYSFTERVSEDVPQTDGTTRKVSVFRHVGFVRVESSSWIED